MALLDLTVESSIEELQAIANQVDGVAEQQGWSQKTVFALQVALDEWISNVIKYSYKERSDQPIRVVVNENEAELIASVEDLGTPFDPSSSAVPAKSSPALSTISGTPSCTSEGTSNSSRSRFSRVLS